MANIKFILDGTSTTLNRNPVSVVVPKSVKSNIVHAVAPADGESINFEESFDNRRGKLIWRGYPSTDSVFSSQINYMKTLVNKKVYMNFGSASGELGHALGVYTSNTPVYIVALNLTVRDGGVIVYSSVELVYEDVESI